MTKTQLIIRALLSLGYSEGRVTPGTQWVDPLFINYRVWCISPTHARALHQRSRRGSLDGTRVWLNVDSGRWRLGNSWSLAKPMPRALAATLANDGQELTRKPVTTLKELGL